MGTNKAIAEAELIRLIDNKDVDALGKLYDLYAAPLFGTVLKLVQDNEVASKVLERAFLEVWSGRRNNSNPEISLFAWMNNMCRDLALAMLDERIKRTQSSDSVSHYKTSLGTVLTAVSFT